MSLRQCEGEFSRTARVWTAILGQALEVFPPTCMLAPEHIQHLARYLALTVTVELSWDEHKDG